MCNGIGKTKPGNGSSKIGITHGLFGRRLCGERQEEVVKRKAEMKKKKKKLRARHEFGQCTAGGEMFSGRSVNTHRQC